VVNEDPTEKLIRELMEENERMKKQLGGGVDMKAIREEAGHDKISKEEEARIRKKLEEDLKANQEANDRAMAEMKQSYEVWIEISF